MTQARVEVMTYGPHGLARLDGKVIFLRHVAPGDEVELAIEEDHGSYAYASLVRLLRPSAERREPPCPYLPRCGGCPWQHLAYPAQLAAKQRNLADHLERIAKLDAPALRPPLPAPAEFGYRHRLSLRVENGRVGFFAAASHELVEVERCLLGSEAVNALLAPARRLVRALRMRVKRLELAAEGASARAALALEAEGGWVEADGQVIAGWLAENPNVAGVVARGRGWRRVWGDPTVRLEVAPGQFVRVHAGVFTQVHPTANRILVGSVLACLQLRPGARVADAYCGAGNFTLPLAAQGARVVAIEQDATACADLRANLECAGLAARVIEKPAHVALRRLVEEHARIDALLLDPPRGGARETIPYILELLPARIVYVSCHSAALARDLAALRSRYQVESVQLLDMFPQTYHAEAVANLVLTC